METRTPQQRAEAIYAALRTAPLAALYWWRAVPLEDHNEVCGCLGDLALRRIIQLENDNSRSSTCGLEESFSTIWPLDMPVELDEFLRRELATIERRSAFRVIPGGS